MGLVIVTGNKPEHHYVANFLTKAHEADSILVCDPPPRRHWKSVLKKDPINFLDKALRQVYLRLIGDGKARDARLTEVFGASSEEFERPDLVRHVGLPMAGELARVVAELNPTVLAVYGTGIIPDNVLKLAGRVALNMHTGLSPEYRGVACAFWPIRDERPDMVGATVHECTSDVDGGLIYFRAPASLYPEDDLHTIFARAVVTGAEGYAKIVGEALTGSLKGVPQDLSKGQEFLGAQLGILSELQTRMALRRLRRAGRLGQLNSP